MSITYENSYNGLSINTNKEKGHGCDTKVLDKIHGHLFDMNDKHSKVMVQRFDLHYHARESVVPADGSVNQANDPVTPSIKHWHTFHRNLRKDLSRNNPLPKEGNLRATSTRSSRHNVDPRIIGVQEQHGKSPHPHIHGIVMVNANAKQSPHDLFTRIEHHWNNALGLPPDTKGLVDHCDKKGPNGIIINRNSNEFEQQLNAVSRQISYPTKDRGKENELMSPWSVLGSRTPK